MRILSCLKRNKTEDRIRIIQANNSTKNRAKKFANNKISTTKYNIITFLPKNLWEQFYRLTNVFFLLQMCLQFVPQIKTTDPIGGIITLIVVLAIASTKDAIDDYRRYRSDKEVNNRPIEILIGKKLVINKWKNIHVGDIIHLSANDFVPADMVLISTSESNGVCYIETAELDGETNLKYRRALEETIPFQDDLEQLANFDAEIECEIPNNNLVRFQGNLKWKNNVQSLSNDNVLLRGTRLRNTHWIFGIVCYAGADTKLMQNSSKPKFKRTKTDRIVNSILFGILFFVFIVCASMAICCGFWESSVGDHFRSYLPRESHISSNRQTGAIQTSLLVFISYILLLNNFIPFTLYIMIDFIRLLQSKWISWDNQMYDVSSNVQAQARTAALNEQLGQIDYIFSDKTGTLTQNVMTFSKCSIRGKLYGYVTDETGHEVQDIEKLTAIKFKEQDEDFVWYDQTLLDILTEGNDNDVNNFFTLLALCQTVMAEERDGKIFYEAQSSDEKALVIAARSFGFAFMNRTQSSITIRIQDRMETYDLLHILDFNNYRRRMSVIVRKADRILLLCKGADSTIKERLDPSEREVMAITAKHLHKMAAEGLRTLCLAWKELNEEDYHGWAKRLHEAKTSMEGRDELVDSVYEEIEKNLRLLGVTAIEDKLQNGVPQCIERLTEAGIKIWMLTGDNVETAQHVGHACRILTDEMIIKRIEEESESDVSIALDQFRNEIIETIEKLFPVHIKDRSKRLDWKTWGIDVFKLDQHRKLYRDGHYQTTAENTSNLEPFGGFGLVITGSALMHAFSGKLKMKFLELCMMCKAVVCSRMTPLQKGQIVDLMMENKKKITLAIGDGANDVSMLHKAHVGIGISGLEGHQAVLASDYSIGQFRFLERLLLVHGRWSYLRLSKFIRFYFYKNFAFTFCQLWYGFFSGFSAQDIYDAVFLNTFNVFSSLPVLVTAIFDQDISADHSIDSPHLYIVGHNSGFFNKKIFIECALHGILTSIAIFFISYFSLSTSIRSNGQTQSDLQSFSFAITTILSIVVNLENALETWYWARIYHYVLWGTVIFHFILYLAIYSTIIKELFGNPYHAVGVAQTVFSTGDFWFTFLLICVILLLPIIGREFFRMRFIPNKTDKVRLNRKFHNNNKAVLADHIPQKRRKYSQHQVRWTKVNNELT